MAYRAVLPLIIFVLMACGLLDVSCNQFQAKRTENAIPERLSVAPGCLASGQHCFTMNVRYISAKSTGSRDNVARLGFSVDDGASETKPMEISDPQRPQGALEEFSACQVEMKPQMTKASVTSENAQECVADTTYWFELSSSEKEPIADFTVDENANLSIVTGSVKKPFSAQLVSTRGRSIYIIYRVTPVTAKQTPLFAFEWLPDDTYLSHSITAADGWRYEFRGHNGKLGFFHASCLGTLPDDLTLVASAEQQANLDELRAWSKAELNKPRRGG